MATYKYYHATSAGYTGYQGTATSFDTVSFSPPKHATILETRPPANEWCDVVRVGAPTGQNYSLGDLVNVFGENPVEDRPVVPGKIVEFDSTKVAIYLIQPGVRRWFGYDQIELLSDSEAETTRLDPNTAFKRRKKRRIW